MDQAHAQSDAKNDLRRRLLAERKALTPDRRLSLDRQLCAHVLRFMDRRPGNTVAAFQPFRGEPDLRPALRALHDAGRCVHLPVLENEHMAFRRWTPRSALTPNRFGIPEPLDGAPCPVAELEWVLMPLVAFSPTGARLGMGGGFYDRSFAFCLQPDCEKRPMLVGVAYSLQKVDSLPMDDWDVPLDAVVTDQGFRPFPAASGRA